MKSALLLLVLAAGCAGTAASAGVGPEELIPAGSEFATASGMRVILMPDSEVPLVAFRLRFAGGSMEDAAGKEGTASLLASLLSCGAGSRDLPAFSEAVEFVGGSVGAAAAQRSVTLSADFLKDDGDLALELLADMAQRPRLAPGDFERERALAIDGLRASREEPQSVMPQYWGSFMFRGTPWSRPVVGSEETLAAVTLDDVRAAARSQLAPDRAWFVVAGDFEPSAMRAAIEARFGGWTSKSAPPAAKPATPRAASGKVLLVDAPDAWQTFFRFGNMAFDWSDPDFAARYVANTVFGGRFTSRLNAKLRTELGLTYGAGSNFDDSRGGLFFVSSYTETGKAEACMTTALALYREFLDRGLTAEELESSKAYIRGQYAPNAVETADQRADLLLSLRFDGLSRDLVNTLLAKVDAVTLDDVNRVVRERFPRDLSWVVIGKAEAVRPVVSQFGDVTETSITAPGWGPR
ncbi:MAG: putative zinc protease [Planctomycetes bacterium]|nr:putative zinc protease [Planctomycetota bacterium]